MTKTINGLARFAALTLALGFAAAHLQAQSGVFNLPVQAHWGNLLLEPGVHSLQIPLSVGQKIVYLREGDNTRLTTPLVMDSNSASDHSYLRLVRIDGQYYVDAFQCAATSQRFLFSHPKTPRKAGAQPVETEAALVQVTGD